VWEPNPHWFFTAKRIVLKGFPLWQATFQTWMEVKQGIFKIHPYLGQKISRQPLYFNPNICNEYNVMWGESKLTTSFNDGLSKV
jgi:hypothetical protein